MNHLERQRLYRGTEHLQSLGSRAIAEFLEEIARTVGGGAFILDQLAQYERRLTPAMVRRIGADRFPPRPLHEVPR